MVKERLERKASRYVMEGLFTLLEVLLSMEQMGGRELTHCFYFFPLWTLLSCGLTL